MRRMWACCVPGSSLCDSFIYVLNRSTCPHHPLQSIMFLAMKQDSTARKLAQSGGSNVNSNRWVAVRL